MASKQISLPDIGPVSLYKRRGVRNIRLSISAKGQVRVTMPVWLPYDEAVSFVHSRRDWIAANAGDYRQPLLHGQTIGKSHRLVFEKTPAARKVASRVTAAAIYVTYPAGQLSSDPDVQNSARKASIRALRSQAEAVLPRRLQQLASQHGFAYRSVQIKQLSGRWGSCDTHQNIVLNLFLMQLPWELVDYVILHELTHTRVMKHGPEFWQAMARVLPEVQQRRQAMRRYRPAVSPEA